MPAPNAPLPGQPYGVQAREMLEHLTLGKDVDVRILWTDKEGRQAVKMTVDGRNIAVELVGAGLAWYDSCHRTNNRLSAAMAPGKGDEAGPVVASQSCAPLGIQGFPPRPERGPHHKRALEI